MRFTLKLKVESMSYFLRAMPYSYVVPECREDWTFAFPSDPALILQRRVAFKRMGPNTQDRRVLKKGAVPSIFPFSKNVPSETAVARVERATKRQKVRFGEDDVHALWFITATMK